MLVIESFKHVQGKFSKRVDHALGPVWTTILQSCHSFLLKKCKGISCKNFRHHFEMVQFNSIKCVFIMKVIVRRNIVSLGKVEKYWLEKEYMLYENSTMKLYTSLVKPGSLARSNETMIVQFAFDRNGFGERFYVPLFSCFCILFTGLEGRKCQIAEGLRPCQVSA